MSVFDAYVRLEGTLSGSVRCDEPMTRHTTYRIGGPAALFIECTSIADLALVCDVLAEEHVAWAVIGKGSNVLVSDTGYDAAVITLTGEFSSCDFGGLEKRDEMSVSLETGQELAVTIGAATPLARVVQQAFGYGLSGLEFAVGVPGTFGGALFMNAGSRDEWIGSRVLTITSYKPGFGLKKTRGNEIAWDYRSSGLPADEIIVEATIALRVGDKDKIAAAMQERLDARTAVQPLSERSCGSVFKNPPGKSAGQLISDCGLSGASCGGAQISALHSNFIVNTGSACADDVLALIRLARDRVKETYGTTLGPEVKFLGFPA